MKIRGFRIEPGEIEARLREHPAVREAVVLVREDEPGEKRLVAYVVGDRRSRPEALRAHLGERLPEHMVPAAFVRLEMLPLTPNGKLDREALPAPDGGACGGGYVAPRTPAEQALAGIWGEVLGAGAGGRGTTTSSSWAATRCWPRGWSRASARCWPWSCRCGRCSSATVRRTWRSVLEALRRAGLPVLPPIEPVRARRAPAALLRAAAPLVPGADGGLGSAYYNVASGMRLGGALDRAALARALDEIVGPPRGAAHDVHGGGRGAGAAGRAPRTRDSHLGGGLSA